MTRIEDYSRLFSSPSLGLDEDYLDVLGPTLAGPVRTFLEEESHALVACSEGLVALLERWTRGALGFEDVWDPSLSLAYVRSCQAVSGGAVMAGVAAAFWAHQLGFQGSWQATLPSPARMAFGCWLLPPTSALDVDVADDAALIKTSVNGSRTALRFERVNSHWHPAQALERLAEVPLIGRNALILRQNLLLDEAYHPIRDEVLEESPKGEHLEALAGAARLLRRAVPAYAEWVDRVVRYIIPLADSPGAIRSGSYAARPGVIFLSMDTRPAAIGEMLVHESSHQYFYLISRFGSVVEGSEERLYYSPIKGTERPLQYILLGYHAFANVLLYSRELIRQGADEDGYCESTLEPLTSQVSEMEKTLASCDGLTAIGRALWEPLAEQLGR